MATKKNTKVEPSSAILAQVKSLRKSLCGALIGLVIGGIIPVITYWLAHYRTHQCPMFWIIVAGGLSFSSITVFAWGMMAFQNKFKAVGLVLLLEATLTFASGWGAIACLAVVVLINAVSMAHALVVGEKKSRRR